jgi:hypothetical protein
VWRARPSSVKSFTRARAHVAAMTASQMALPAMPSEDRAHVVSREHGVRLDEAMRDEDERWTRRD